LDTTVKKKRTKNGIKNGNTNGAGAEEKCNGTGTGTGGDKDKLSSDEWLALQLKKIQHNRRIDKAEQTLLEMQASEVEAGKDVAWIDQAMADLEKFVAEHKEELDELLDREDREEVRSGGDGGTKRERNDNEKEGEDAVMNDANPDQPPNKKHIEA